MPCTPGYIRRPFFLNESVILFVRDIMVLPVLKLALLAVKQVAKPVANRIKGAALGSERFRQVMVRTGRRLHLNAFQVDRMADGKASLEAHYVPKIKEKEALERGSDFLAEMVVYSITAGVLGVEQWYSKKKERERSALEAAKLAAKEADARRLNALNEEQQWAEFKRLHQALVALQGRVNELEERGSRRWFGGRA